MREVMIIELSPNFHTELLMGLRKERVAVWQAYTIDHITEAFDVDAQFSFALVDSALSVTSEGLRLTQEFRRWFPHVPLLKIVGLTLKEQAVRIRIRGKSMTVITFPEPNIFEKIESALQRDPRRQVAAQGA